MYIGDPQNKDYSILGFVLGSPIWGNHQTLRPGPKSQLFEAWPSFWVSLRLLVLRHAPSSSFQRRRAASQMSYFQDRACKDGRSASFGSVV